MFSSDSGAWRLRAGRKRGSRRSLVWLLAAFAPALLAVAAAAQMDRAADDAWLPAAGITGSIDVFGMRGRLASSPPARPNALGDDLSVSPVVGLNTELMTPPWLADRLEVRLVAHADVAFAASFERSVAREGNPGGFRFPPVDDPAPGGTDVQPSEVAGRGSEAKAQLQPVLFFAGAGVALGFDWLERRFRVKPTLEYRLDEVELQGLAAEVTGVRTVLPGGIIDPDFRRIRIRGSESQLFHSVGPGLELEAETARVNDFVVAIFATGRAWAVLGDRDIRLRGRCCSDTGPEETASWRFERDPWGFGSSVGIRVRWSPEE